LRHKGCTPRPCRADHILGTPDAVARLDNKPITVTIYAFNPDRALHGQIVSALILGKIPNDVCSRRVLFAFLSRHPPSRQCTVLGRSEKPQRLPPVPPSHTTLHATVENRPAK